MVPPALPLLTSRDRDDARRLVESVGLSFEAGFDDIVGIHDDGRLVATAARAGYVLKMFAIEEAWQGGETLGQLVTALADLAGRAGHDALFVYTRPAQAPSFEACGFRLLVACGEVALLEYGGGLERYLKATGLQPCGTGRGAVVINGNPFTLGHQYLVEYAAARVPRLYVFVVREDRSVFPFDLRYQLAREGIAHVANAVLLDTSRYAVSAGTFPSYFLRQHDDARGSRWRSTCACSARTSRRRWASAGGSSARNRTARPRAPTTPRSRGYCRSMASRWKWCRARGTTRAPTARHGCERPSPPATWRPWRGWCRGPHWTY